LSVNLLKEGDRSKGLAFVKFATAAGMNKAIAGSGVNHMERSLTI